MNIPWRYNAKTGKYTRELPEVGERIFARNEKGEAFDACYDKFLTWGMKRPLKFQTWKRGFPLDNIVCWRYANLIELSNYPKEDENA